MPPERLQNKRSFDVHVENVNMQILLKIEPVHNKAPDWLVQEGRQGKDGSQQTAVEECSLMSGSFSVVIRSTHPHPQACAHACADRTRLRTHIPEFWY